MDPFTRTGHQGWNKRAAAYDTHFAAITRQAIAPILASVAPVAGRAFLDIACGTGDLAAAAAAEGADVTGVDFSERMIGIARRKVPKARFVIGDAEALDIEAGGFDIATCAFGLWHMQDPERAISEAARVLRPGGRYAYSGWSRPGDDDQMTAILTRAIETHGTPGVDLPETPPPYRFADPAAAHPVLWACGFRAVDFHEHHAEWHGESGRDLLDLIHQSIVPAPLPIDAQTPAARAAIDAAIIEGAEVLKREGTIRLRLSYVVVSALRAP